MGGLKKTKMDCFKMNKYTFRVLIVFLIFLFGENGIAQTMVTGKISDEETDIKISGVDVALLKKGNFIRNTITDVNGNYSLIVDPGTYEMEFSKRGFPTERIIEIIVIEGQTTKLNIQLLYDRHLCGLVTQMRFPLIKSDKMEEGQVLLDKNIKANPIREIRKMVLMTPGVTF